MRDLKAVARNVRERRWKLVLGDDGTIRTLTWPKLEVSDFLVYAAPDEPADEPEEEPEDESDVRHALVHSLAMLLLAGIQCEEGFTVLEWWKWAEGLLGNRGYGVAERLGILQDAAVLAAEVHERRDEE